jgi:hypothetical protein
MTMVLFVLDGLEASRLRALGRAKRPTQASAVRTPRRRGDSLAGGAEGQLRFVVKSRLGANLAASRASAKAASMSPKSRRAMSQ